jgi:hypothetical protein
MHYAHSNRAPNTLYTRFKAVHSQRTGSDNSGSTTDYESGASPISRWVAMAFDYSDFTSNSEALGYVARLPVPAGTLAIGCFARVDTLFASTGANDIDVGDGDGADDWLDGVDFSSVGIKCDWDDAYNRSNGTGKFYRYGDTIDVKWKNATAPTAGKAIIFLEVVSYNEDYNAEW